MKLGGFAQRPVDRPPSLRSDDYDEWDSRFMLRTDQDDFGTGYNEKWGQKGWFKPSCIPISIILLLIILVVLLPLLDAAEKQHRTAAHNMTLNKCQQTCNFSLIETIPDGMSYRNGSSPFPTTYNLWREMIANANHTIEIVSYYWALRNGDATNYPGTDKGEAIFADLYAAGKERKLTVKIVQSQPSKSAPNTDTEMFTRKGAAEVRSVNMPKLVGGGVLHTKLWIIDRTSAYIGSANADWRSLSQVKEMGIFISNCSCLLNDIGKIFDIYWDMGIPDASIPVVWQDELSTEFNDKSPMHVVLNDTRASVYISSSPPPFCPNGRETDLDSILNIIHRADKFIYIAVMDYMPLMIYTAKPQFWPVIDNALRTATINQRVEIRLLISHWNYTRSAEKLFLKSLVDISNTYKGVNVLVCIESKLDSAYLNCENSGFFSAPRTDSILYLGTVSLSWLKLFVVPSTAAQSKIPDARVNQNKYMVTDNVAYIGTSNWSGDYFSNTAGVGVIIEGDTYIRSDLESVFFRDWNSEFAYPLPK